MGPKGVGIKGVSISHSIDKETPNLKVLLIELTDGTFLRAGDFTVPAGTVTLEFTEGGKLLKQIENIPSGKTVRQPIERFTEKQ